MSVALAQDEQLLAEAACVARISRVDSDASDSTAAMSDSTTGAPTTTATSSPSLPSIPAEDSPQPATFANPAVLARRDSFKEAVRAGKAFLVFDFDRTITCGVSRDGVKGGVSCHNIVESSRLLSDEFFVGSQKLHKHYYAIETCDQLSVEEKVPHMTEWYQLSHGLLEKEGLRQEQIPEAVKKAVPRLLIREGFAEVCALARKHKVPLMVMSAGLAQVLEEVLLQMMPDGLVDSYHVVSNHMTFDDEGVHSGFDGPLLHMFNKSLGFAGSDVLDELAGKTHAIVCGDSVGDLTMANGVDHLEDIVKVGITNDLEKWPGDRMHDEGFDVVVHGAVAPLTPIIDALTL